MSDKAAGLRERARQIADPQTGPVRQPQARMTGGGGADGGPLWVVVRLVTSNAMHVQRVEYKDDPPQIGEVRATGEFFAAYPPPGWEYDQCKWFLFPLMDGDTVLTTADADAMAAEQLGTYFYVCKVHKLGSVFVLDPPLKMPTNVEFMNEDDEMSEGMGL